MFILKTTSLYVRCDDIIYFNVCSIFYCVFKELEIVFYVSIEVTFLNFSSKLLLKYSFSSNEFNQFL